ncbi:hypothetical protein NHX12_017065 [Muraenolepis orangiensis]|uniref:Protein root UVB sensitive/RUS domain-containing protein n=1 Tax=Muraenolepis orangiensis TaxID=630683 RepID=A0A9Q0D3G6_9TELE|nr:hypothetical protein NHX12_017496 [Muraenolepis orangiensis]KAJ3581084.1 hypothetical protein NHX12_017065 [Muraenolepis orangiensis]
MEENEQVVLATEKYGSGESWDYVAKEGALERRRDGSDVGGSCITGVFKSVFLPQGYPESVSEDYLRYQFWDTVQSIVGVAGGATRAALTVHQACRDNMADISAKDGSQVPVHPHGYWGGTK